MEKLTYAEELRYNRQIILKAIDFEGQEKLKQSKIVIIGLGGLGCAAAQYLATSGVGELTLVDFDTVSISNLQRQILHNDQRLGMLKVDSAAAALSQMNPHVRIHTVKQQLSENALYNIIVNCDVVLDCSDNLDTRNRIDKCCEKARTPLVSGAAIRIEGHLSTFTYTENSPTYRQLSKLFANNHHLTCVEAGILSPMVGIIGSFQALEALKLILNVGKTLVGRLLIIDGLFMDIRVLKL